VDGILKKLKPIGLEQIGSRNSSVALLKRRDTKFVLPHSVLPEVIAELGASYQVLEIAGKRQFSYKNLYFDTPESFFYLEHHNQKLNRHKVRFRSYVDSDLTFFEVKLKSNKGVTQKKRLKKNLDWGLDEELRRFLVKNMHANSPVDPNSVVPRLWIEFSRITLASLTYQERITFDFNITFRLPDHGSISLDQIAVAEVKKEGRSLHSPIFSCFRRRRIFPTKFTKYCTGMALLDSEIKKNRFKRRILILSKIQKGLRQCL
jgi:hypothetical protein